MRRRVEEISKRLKQKYGYDSVSHLSNNSGGKFVEKIGKNISILLECDGIVLDNPHHLSRSCSIEEYVAKCIAQWKKPFIFLHTEEEFNEVKTKYVV
ncbi:MAG: hypothetical protein KBT03_11015 [Bacteroidales bacterium]|nr:hypothetical protein [Candidatus Scybalousia scybalohippi]